MFFYSVVYSSGGINDDSVDRDFYLQFHEVDENLSHYLDENIELFLGEDPETFEGDDDFEESNKMKGWRFVYTWGYGAMNLLNN